MVISAYDILTKLQEEYQICIWVMSVYKVLDFLYKIDNILHRLKLVSKYFLVCRSRVTINMSLVNCLLLGIVISIAKIAIDKTLTRI